MPRLPTLRSAARQSCGVVSASRLTVGVLAVALGLIGMPPTARAQYVLEVPLFDIPWSHTARVSALSTDGSRLLVHAGSLSGERARTQVIDRDTGVTHFDSRSHETEFRSVGAVVLSPDGAHVTFTIADKASGLNELRVSDLSTGHIRLVHTATSTLVPAALANGALLVAFLDYALPAPRVGLATSSEPVSWLDAICPGDRQDSPPTVLLSADGTTVVTVRRAAGESNRARRVGIADLPTLNVRCLTPPVELDVARRLYLTRDGRWLGFTAAPLYDAATAGVSDTARSGATLLDLELGVTLGAAPLVPGQPLYGLSDDVRYLLLGTRSLFEYRLYDRVTGLVTAARVPESKAWATIGSLSADGQTLVIDRDSGTVKNPYLHNFLARLDADRDGLSDPWEATFGLSPSNPQDAALDPDGDGRTGLEEYVAGTHPNGTPTGYFAEGANGDFFATSLALFNPAGADIAVNLRFLGPDGAAIAKPAIVPATGPAYVDADDANLPFTEFSIVVESLVPIVAERRMTWDRSYRYGSHRSAGVAAPSMTWHFAEGATIAGFQTFLLLQNPSAQPATVTLHYLLATGTTETRTHVVPAQSRLTVWANQEGAPMHAAEFAMTVVADVPIVAERAMYRDAPGEMFAAGSVAAGVVTPAASWFFAEGATGDYFDTYILVANPGDQLANVQATYVRAFDPADPSTATPIERTYTVPARTRLTLWVAREDPALASTQVSTRLTSDVPIVAERAMWWPGPTAATWRESHAEIGATVDGLHWAVADLPVAWEPEVEDAFLLLATTQPTLAMARVSLTCAEGTRVSRDLSLWLHRTTLWIRHVFPETVGQRCAATVESLPARVTLSPEVPLMRVPLIVESAIYGNGFTSGAVTLATKLPDP